MADPEYVTLLTLKALATRCQSLASRNRCRGRSAPGNPRRLRADALRPSRCRNGSSQPALGHRRGQPGPAWETKPSSLPSSGSPPYRHHQARQPATGSAEAATATPTMPCYQVVLVRMASCQRTKDYVAKRTAEGKSKREIMRCLKRYAAREIYRQITNPQPAPNNCRPPPDAHHTRSHHQTAARELGQWPSKISLLERGLLRNDDLATTYRQWLSQQTAAHLHAREAGSEVEGSLVS